MKIQQFAHNLCLLGIGGAVFFSCFVSVSAQSHALKIESLQALQDYFTEDNNLPAFIKATLENSSEEHDIEMALSFQNPMMHPEDSEEEIQDLFQETDGYLDTAAEEEIQDQPQETNGYLDVATDAEIRTRLEQNFATECNVLLHDFFKTALYSDIRKVLKDAVAITVPHSFFTDEEVRQLIDLDYYYPDTYADAGNDQGYKWEYILDQDQKPVAVCGRLAKIIGLKGNKDYLGDAFFVLVDAEYRCSFQSKEKRTVGFKNKAMGQYMLVSNGDLAAPLVPVANITTLDVLVGPKHSFATKIIFCRKHKNGNASTIVHEVFAFESERVTLNQSISVDSFAAARQLPEAISTVNNDQKIMEKHKDSFIDELDLSIAELPAQFWGSVQIATSNDNDIWFDDLLKQCPNFIFPTDT